MSSDKFPKKGSYPTTPQARPGAQASRAELDVLRSKITDRVLGDPAKAARLISIWLDQPAKKPTLRRTG